MFKALENVVRAKQLQSQDSDCTFWFGIAHFLVSLRILITVIDGLKLIVMKIMIKV